MTPLLSENLNLENLTQEALTDLIIAYNKKSEYLNSAKNECIRIMNQSIGNADHDLFMRRIAATQILRKLEYGETS